MSVCSTATPLLHEASTLMTAPPAPKSLYVTRWKTCLITLVFAGFLWVAFQFYFVWPTPSAATNPWAYQEPAKTIAFLVWGLLGAFGVMAGLYQTLTPRPILQLSATSLVYHRFLRPTQTIFWDDVEQVTAYHDGMSRRVPSRMLTLSFTFKPHRFSADQVQQRRQMDIYAQLLSLSADELIDLIGTYHHVHALRIPRNPQNT